MAAQFRPRTLALLACFAFLFFSCLREVEAALPAATHAPSPGAAAAAPTSPAKPAPEPYGEVPRSGSSPFTDVCGAIPPGTIWTLANSPYVATCDIYIPPGVTLAVQPGVVVKIQNPTNQVYVDGTLAAMGSAGQPIIFTSYRDDGAGGDTNGDGSATAPAPGDWRRLTFAGASTGSILQHAEVRYGGYDWGQSVYVNTSNITLVDSTFAYARDVGVFFDGAMPATLAGNHFVGNAVAPAWLRFSGGVSFALEGNQATGNGVNGFMLEANVTDGNNVTWDGDDAFPIVIQDITGNSGSQVTISPGTVLKFRTPSTVARFWGNLTAVGTADKPIIFTSLHDDTAGGDTDGAITAPAPGDWRALTFEGSSSGALQFAEVRYGGYDWGSSVFVATPNVTVSDSTFTHAAGNGLFFDGAMPATLARNHFSYNTNAAARLRFSGGFSFALEGNQATGNGINGFMLEANVTEGNNVTWDGDDGLPFVVQSLAVNRGAQLTFTPGTVAKFWYPYGYGYMSISGTLIARGTADRPIVFTSLRDDAAGGDTNGDGAATSPAPGDWGNLSFENAAPVSGNALEYAVVRYGGHNYHQIYVAGTDLTMLHSASTNAGSPGLSLNSASAFVRDSAFMTDTVGVWVGGSSNVILIESRIASNRDYGVQNYSAPRMVDARDNWWGHATGPHHSTQNPGGQGDEVSNGVMFNPWFEQPRGSPVRRVILQVLGPRSGTPGDTLDTMINYYTYDAVDNAVLLFSIPFGSSFVSASNDGQYYGSSGQVYWKLGNLPAMTQGTVRVRAQVLWGLPTGFPDASAVMMGGSNLQIAPYAIDTAPYDAHQPVRVTGSTPLTGAQIDAALQASPPLKALYDPFIAQGFKRLGGTSLASSDGHQTTQVLLVHPQSYALVDLRRDQTTNEVSAITFAGDAITVTDANGAMSFDLLQNMATGSGLWAESSPIAQAAGTSVAPSAEEIRPFTCFRNCALKETGMWAIKKLSSTVKAVLAMRSCLQAIGGDPAAVDSCVGLFTSKVSETVPGFSEVKAFTKCLSECVNPDTRQKHVCTGPLTTVELPTWSWFNPASWTEGGRKRQYIVYACNTTTGMWGSASVLYCPRGFVAQQGADDGYGHPCVPANEDIAFAYGYDDRKVPSASSQVTLNAARDPNAKYGVDGAIQAEVLPDQTLTYTITCENEGSGTAYGVYILDTLSQNLDETTLDLGGMGQFSPALRQLSWDIGDLAPKGSPGSTAEVSFTIKPKAGLSNGTEILNQAVVYFPSVPETTPTNVVINTIQPIAAVPQTVQAVAGSARAITLEGHGGGALTYSIVDPPLYGVLSGAPPNLSYTTDGKHSSSDAFTFRVAGGGRQSTPAEVKINIAPSSNDTTPPAVQWITPADRVVLPAPSPASFVDALGVGYYPLVTIQFSEPLDAATVTNANVYLRSGGQPVNSTVQFVAGLNQVLVTPRQAMAEDLLYTVTVTTDVKDGGGNALGTPFTSSFKLREQAEENRKVCLPLILR